MTFCSSTSEFSAAELVCVTEQHYVSIFFTRLWSVRKPLLFDTQNPGISGFSTAQAYIQNQTASKNEARQQKNFC